MLELSFYFLCYVLIQLSLSNQADAIRISKKAKDGIMLIAILKITFFFLQRTLQSDHGEGAVVQTVATTEHKKNSF